MELYCYTGSYFAQNFKMKLHCPPMFADRPILVSAQQSVQLLSVLRKHQVNSQFSFSLFFIGVVNLPERYPFSRQQNHAYAVFHPSTRLLNRTRFTSELNEVC